MNWEAIGAIAELLGAIGVIASLVYLAGQIGHSREQMKQNTAALQTTSRQDIVSGYRMHARLLLEPGMWRTFAEGLRRYPDMPPDEMGRFWNIFGDHAVFFQGVFALHESGTLEDETYQAYLDWFASHAATPGGSAVWKQFHLIMPRRMVEAVDARLTSGGLLDLGELPPFKLDGFQPPTSGEQRGSTGA